MEITNINQSLFIEVMGDSPINRVLNFLVINEDYDYSLTDIAKYAKVGYSTLQLFWTKLEKAGIVKQTRKVGKAKMYRLNKANPAVKHFIKMYWEITEAITEQLHPEFRKKKIAAKVR